MQLPLERLEFPLLRGVGQPLLVGEVEQLQHGGHDATRAPQDQRVELQLKKGLGLPTLAGCLARLVVDHAQRAVGCLIEPVNDAAKSQTAVQHVLDVFLAVRGLDPARVFEREIALHERFRGGKPLLFVGQLGATEQSRGIRVGVAQLLPRRQQRGIGCRGRPLPRREVEQTFENRMDEGSPHGLPTRRLGHLVNHSQPVSKRAALEVRGTRRGQRPGPRKSTRTWHRRRAAVRSGGHDRLIVCTLFGRHG